MEKRTFRENSVIFEPTNNEVIDQEEVIIEHTHRDSQSHSATQSLPDTLPSPLNLKNVPEALLKSGAMNALIQQNEDLVSRLSVSIRRYSRLEEEIEDRNKRISQLITNEASYKDQVLILERKAQLVDERTKDIRERNEHLEREVKLLETRYSELYSNNRNKLVNMTKELHHERKKAARLTRYRSRILKISTEIRGEISNLRLQIQKLEAEYAVLHESHQSLRERMTASAEHIQKKETRHQDHISQLTENYESQLRKLEDHLLSRESETEGLKSELVKFANLSEEKIESDNEVVLLKRKLAELKEDYEQQLNSTQKELVKYRGESKQRTLENEKQLQTIAQLENERSLQNERLQTLEDQVESLQIVWSQSHDDLEKEKQKNQSLQSLNQQISLSLNESRQKLNQMKETNEAARAKNRHSVSKLENQVRTLSKELETRDHAENEQQISPHESVKRIEALISKTFQDLTNI